MTFPQIQMALFKHEAACGSAPKFALEPGQTAYAKLSDQPLGSNDRQQIIVADLMYYRGSDLGGWLEADEDRNRSEEHTSELQSLMRISYAGFCLKKKKKLNVKTHKTRLLI